MDFSNPLRLEVRRNVRGRIPKVKFAPAKCFLPPTLTPWNCPACTMPPHQNSPSLWLPLRSLRPSSKPSAFSRHPFYTIDFPYLWGRLLDSNGVIFGAWPCTSYLDAPSSFPLGDRSAKNRIHDLHRYDVRKGESAACLRLLEKRVHHLHPALASVRITHRWCGPILFTEEMRPIFRLHSSSKQVMILAGFNGHGVALSVYLGQWAAEALLARRPLPRWY